MCGAGIDVWRRVHFCTSVVSWTGDTGYVVFPLDGVNKQEVNEAPCPARGCDLDIPPKPLWAHWARTRRNWETDRQNLSPQRRRRPSSRVGPQTRQRAVTHEQRIGGHKARAKDPKRNNRVKAAVGLAPKKRCADWTLIIAASGWLLALNHTNVAIATWCPYLTLSVLIRILRCHSSN